MLFEFENPMRERVYGWVEPRAEHPSIPKIVTVPTGADMNSAEAAFTFHPKSDS